VIWSRGFSRNAIKLRKVQGLAVLEGLPVLTLVPLTNSLT